MKGGFSDSDCQHWIDPTSSSHCEEVFVSEKFPEEGVNEAEVSVGYDVDSIHHRLPQALIHHISIREVDLGEGAHMLEGLDVPVADAVEDSPLMHVLEGLLQSVQFGIESVPRSRVPGSKGGENHLREIVGKGHHELVNPRVGKAQGHSNRVQVSHSAEFIADVMKKSFLLHMEAFEAVKGGGRWRSMSHRSKHAAG